MRASKEPGIYCIMNTVTGHRYIGQSIDISARKRHHFRKLRLGIHANIHLQSSFKKHSEKCFSFSIIERPLIAMLDDRERFWISFYNSMDRSKGFNLVTGGNSKKEVSDETRKRHAEAARNISEATRQKRRETSRLRTCSEESRLRMSEAQKGKKHPGRGGWKRTSRRKRTTARWGYSDGEDKEGCDVIFKKIGKKGKV